MNERKPWDQYFLDIAKMAATRGTCDRKRVGAVIVVNRSIVSTGYNGSMPGRPHCDDIGHQMEDGHCIRTVHAEANAIVQAARFGVSIQNASIYVSCSPCWQCAKMIASAGIKKVFFGETYRSYDTTVTELEMSGVEVANLGKTS